MPNTRAGRDSSSDANVDNSINDDNTNAIALKFIELLNDEQVLAKIKIALYPRDLVNKIDLLSAMVNKLSGQLEQKEQRISQLEQKVQLLELQADGVEQYSRRANLRLYGIPEDENGENTDAKVLEVVNERMRIHPPIQQNDIERSHRLGPKTDRQGQRRSRSIIVRFASERTRDGVYRARFKLKNFNTNHAPIFINEDLTATRSAIAAEARQLKKNKKILDTWTAAGNILVKTLLGTIVQIKSKADLAQY